MECHVDGDVHSEDVMIIFSLRSLVKNSNEVKQRIHHYRNRVDTIII